LVARYSIWILLITFVPSLFLAMAYLCLPLNIKFSIFSKFKLLKLIQMLNVSMSMLFLKINQFLSLQLLFNVIFCNTNILTFIVTFDNVNKNIVETTFVNQKKKKPKRLSDYLMYYIINVKLCGLFLLEPIFNKDGRLKLMTRKICLTIESKDKSMLKLDFWSNIWALESA